MSAWKKFIDNKTPEERQEYMERLREHRKQYRSENKERLNAIDKARYEDRKEDEKEKREEKHACEICGGRYSTHNKSTHLHSQRHINVLHEQDKKDKKSNHNNTQHNHTDVNVD